MANDYKMRNPAGLLQDYVMGYRVPGSEFSQGVNTPRPYYPTGFYQSGGRRFPGITPSQQLPNIQSSLVAEPAPQNYNQLGSMLAALGATRAASFVSGPFAPLVGFGLQWGLQKLIGGSDQDALRRMAKERADAQSQLIPQLQAQAAGRPSPASRAIQEQIRQQLDMSRQAAATSAGRAGQYGTAVARSQQFRQQQALANATALQQGQLAQFSQQQIMGLPAVQMQTGLAAQESMQKAAISTFFQGLLATPDEDLSETKREIKRLRGILDGYTEGNFDTWGSKAIGPRGVRTMPWYSSAQE